MIERVAIEGWASLGTIPLPVGDQDSVPQSLLVDSERDLVWLATWQCEGSCLSAFRPDGSLAFSVNVPTTGIGGIGRMVLASGRLIISSNGTDDMILVVDPVARETVLTCRLTEESNSLPSVLTDGTQIYVLPDSGPIFATDDLFGTAGAIQPTWTGQVWDAAYSLPRHSLLLTGSEVGLVEIPLCSDPSTPASAVWTCEP
ncbi:MAG: hypothetical protein HYV07_06910 [Deltaproteobacteria bacterium]|nr:hypothetical protein [Deltaproteobacteria bacterium]